jgi:hypothetical protein
VPREYANLGIGTLERFPAKWEPVHRRRRVKRKESGAVSESNESETARAGRPSAIFTFLDRSRGRGHATVERVYGASVFMESEDVKMRIPRRSILAALVVTLIGTAPAWSQSALKMLDPDNDSTVDLAEAKSAASKAFDKLDRDHDGTLDRRELRGRINKKDFVAADPDKDGTLDKNEFSAVVEKRFTAANPDNDGTIDAKELKSPAGRSLVRLLK